MHRRAWLWDDLQIEHMDETIPADLISARLMYSHRFDKSACTAVLAFDDALELACVDDFHSDDPSSLDFQFDPLSALNC